MITTVINQRTVHKGTISNTSIQLYFVASKIYYKLKTVHERMLSSTNMGIFNQLSTILGFNSLNPPR